MKHIKNEQIKRCKKRRKASEGMTAAIILIAFIITAAGIAFVVLTLGSTIQNELANTGEEGRKAASSAMQVEGNIVVGYVETDASNITVYTFNLKLVLGSGRVDLSSGSIMVSIIVGNETEQVLTFDSNLDTVAEAEAASNQYGIEWLNRETSDSQAVLEPNEMARFYLGLSDAYGATGNEEVTIIIKSEVAVVKIQETIPVGIEEGSNLI